MGSELIVILLLVIIIAIPIAVWMFLKKISLADQMQKNNEDLHALENSLSLMIQEIQDSVQKALSDMEEAADKLGSMIDKADNRLRQLEYYYEYGDELRPITQPRQDDVPVQPSAQNQSQKHKEVYELNRKGWSAAQIAKHTGMSKDEVQLIVNLMNITAPEEKTQFQLPKHPLR